MANESLLSTMAYRLRMTALPLIGIAFLDVQAQSVYQITDNVTGGIDLTAMEGYYSDRLAGPTDAEVVVEGEIEVNEALLTGESVAVKKNDTPETLQQRVMRQAEWIILPKAVELVSKDILTEKKGYSK